MRRTLQSTIISLDVGLSYRCWRHRLWSLYVHLFI